MFDPAGNDVGHRAYAEEVFIQVLEAGAAHGQLMGQSIYCPVEEGLVVDFGADNGHLVVMRVADFLLGRMNPVAELNEK